MSVSHTSLSVAVTESEPREVREGEGEDESNRQLRVLHGHPNADRANCVELVLAREQIGKRAA
jgi:hypothetical protein